MSKDEADSNARNVKLTEATYTALVRRVWILQAAKHEKRAVILVTRIRTNRDLFTLNLDASCHAYAPKRIHGRKPAC